MIFFFIAFPSPTLNAGPTCFSMSYLRVPSTVERLKILASGVPSFAYNSPSLVRIVFDTF